MKEIIFGTAVLLLLVTIYYVTLTDSCSYPPGWKPPTTIQSLRGADVVLYGKVKQTYPHEYYDTAYTARMEVYCILRGQRTKRFVNITHAGFVHGMCSVTELLKGRVYLVPLLGGGTGSLQGAGASFKEPDQIEEALKACKLNLKPTYPKGIRASSAKVKCPKGLPVGKCKEQYIPT